MNVWACGLFFLALLLFLCLGMLFVLLGEVETQSLALVWGLRLDNLAEREPLGIASILCALLYSALLADPDSMP